MALGLGGAAGYTFHALQTPKPTVASIDPGLNQRLSAIEQQLKTIQEQQVQTPVLYQASDEATGDSNAIANAQTNSRIDQLELMISQLQNQLAASERRAQAELQAVTAANQDETAAVVDHTQQRANKAQRQQQYKELLQTTFASEEEDSVWSSTTHTMIEETLNNNTELAVAKLAARECKSTLCRVEIKYDPGSNSVDQSMAENILLMKLGQALPTSAVRYESDPDGMRMVAYFAKQGHKLPSLSDNKQ